MPAGSCTVPGMVPVASAVVLLFVTKKLFKILHLPSVVRLGCAKTFGTSFFVVAHALFG